MPRCRSRRRGSPRRCSRRWRSGVSATVADAMPVPTLGLSHVSLAVRDPQRSLDFYARAFGVREYFRDDTQIQALGPGPHDVLAFVRDATHAGRIGGIGHFGFRLAQPDDIDAVVAGALAAGGTLLRRGEFAPGLPFAYVA